VHRLLNQLLPTETGCGVNEAPITIHRKGKHVKLALLGSLLLILSGCADLTPTQKKVAGVVAGVLVVGAIAAHRADSGEPSADAADGGGKGGPFHPACQVQKNC
jgi:hypothetical protein